MTSGSYSENLGRIVVVEDDTTYRDHLVATLIARGYEVRSAADGAAGLALVRQWVPDAALLDWILPIIDGGALTRAIKSDPALERVFVIIASARGEAPMRTEGIELGADDYLVKPVDAAELFARLRNGLTLRRLQAELEEKNRELAQLAATDPLTGLPNRRAFDVNLQREVEGARRHGDALSLVLLDVDEFKPVNDRFGHDVGDEVLREIGRRLRLSCRTGDTVARIGGEEFALILTRTGGEGAVSVAERTRAAISGSPAATSVGALSVTVSAGIASAGGPIAFDPQELYRAADDALYEAKRAGRNRVSMASRPK
ncbi:MAG TPA: diguanylate cyclase [Thermoanaerobaculia bacterium]|nr:diguanylate cyclase [Thermoanaerobaculia bacterium]